MSVASERVLIPSGSAPYNAAADLLGRNRSAGRGAKAAVIDERGAHTYADVAAGAERFAGLLRELGIAPEQRVVLGLLDSVDFPICFLGAILAGACPVPVNTLFPPADLAYVLGDSRAPLAVVSQALLPAYEEAASLAGWRGRFLVSGAPPGERALDVALAGAAPLSEPAATRADDACFWLYSSGSTGRPKGTVHVQTSLAHTADLFGCGVLDLRESDVVYSAAKLFFAYGLGNALTFPFAVGATSVLVAGRPTPDVVATVLRERRPTIFCGVPTLFGSLLAHDGLPGRGEHALRLCTSAGEALPEEVGRAWTERVGVEIVDGIGSTEMLHIFVSNRPGAVRYGTTGLPVPGYAVRIVDERGNDVADGDLGELLVSGPSAAAHYWCNREKSRATFVGEWVRTGDKFYRREDGHYVHCGRNDDMLKVGGIWVSPMEVEGALIAHAAVLECAVVGAQDEQGLTKPKAFVVLQAERMPSDALALELQAHVKARLAPYKYPRWIAFVDALPKTATGKIRRHVLREADACGGSQLPTA